jgi:hypothetical protein
MQYEDIEAKPVNGKRALDISNKVLVNAAKKLPTYRLLWIIIVRHKVAILAIGNIILVLNWAVPAWPEIVKSLF